MICPICKGNNFGEHENNGAKFEICKNCGYIVQTRESDEYNNAVEKANTIREQQKNKPIVECPYCHSANTKKISGLSKVGSIAVFGFWAFGKASKQWHCNQCGSDF